MRTLRSSLFVLGLVFLVYLFAPSASFAQEDPMPPCCHNDSVIVLPLEDGTIIIILDPDSVTPPENGQPSTTPIAQLSPSDSPAVLPEVAADRSKLATAPKGLSWSA
jgi:hypothetical protein